MVICWVLNSNPSQAARLFLLAVNSKGRKGLSTGCFREICYPPSILSTVLPTPLAHHFRIDYLTNGALATEMAQLAYPTQGTIMGIASRSSFE